MTRAYVSRLAGLTVFDPNGDLVGRVRDVLVALRIGRDAPRVLGLAVEIQARRRIFVPIGRVTGIDPEGAAAEKGLAPGDIITEAGQQPVATIADLNARIDEAREAGRKSLLVLVRRDGEPRFVALPVSES